MRSLKVNSQRSTVAIRHYSVICILVFINRTEEDNYECIKGRSKNKKGQPSRLPQSFLNLKSNTMKNTLQSYDFFLN